MNNKIIGIDLGTTNSVVSVMEGPTINVIKQPNGDKLLPSLVAYNNKNGDVLVGAAAENVISHEDWTVIRSIKSSMGKSEITNKETGEKIELKNSSGKDIRPEEVSAHILKELKNTAEDVLGHEVNRAVVTVPAYFNDAERNATKTAGEIAGLKIERVINEPTAAAMEYGYAENKDNKKSGLTLVYDFGGGTFDVSVIDISEDQTYHVISTGGDNKLGGDNLDKLVSELITEKFYDEYDSKSITQLFDFESRVYEASIKAKKELSFQNEVNVSIPMIGLGKNGPINLNLTINVDEFNDLIRPLIKKTIDITKDILKESNKDINDIDELLLVGGSTRIPLVKEMINDEFGKEINMTVDPDESVSKGASIQGALINGELEDILLLDVTPHDLGIITIGDEFSKLIGKNSIVPIRKKDMYTNVVDWQEEILIQVVQGDKYLPASKNELIGEFYIDITPAPVGKAQVEVTFQLDANGILEITTLDSSTGNTKTVTINNDNSMSDNEIKASKLELN